MHPLPFQGLRSNSCPLESIPMRSVPLLLIHSHSTFLAAHAVPFQDLVSNSYLFESIPMRSVPLLRIRSHSRTWAPIPTDCNPFQCGQISCCVFGPIPETRVSFLPGAIHSNAFNSLAALPISFQDVGSHSYPLQTIPMQLTPLL